MTRRALERRFRRIRELGCLPCRRMGWYAIPDVHHLNEGGHAGHKRRGDECTVGLCPWHHRGKLPYAFLADEVREILGPSLALEPNKFREQFGSDDALLAWENELIQAAERRASWWLR
jgi:hypothetical protein